MARAPHPETDTALPVIAVGAVIVRGGRLLLVLRGHPPGAGRWSLPGGRLQPGESLAAAVAREAYEETGLVVSVDRLCGVAEHRSPDGRYVIIDYWASAPDDQRAVAGDDAAEVCWARGADLDRLDLVDGLRAFLDEHGVAAALE